jgi:PLP dependent protein
VIDIRYILDKVREAALQSGRASEAITVVGVTKTISVDKIAEAVKSGIFEIGENRVQEALSKREPLEAILPKESYPLRWHLIGHLQHNKAKLAVPFFDLIHSVDSLRLAEEINRQAEVRNTKTEILLQVNVSGEKTKFGFHPRDLELFLNSISRLSHIRIKGLMTLAPYSEDPEYSRPSFCKLKKIFDQLSKQEYANVEMTTLSMGMSQDYQVAIEEGATLVRIGRAIFGERHVR